ncbi:serine/threonine kinase [Halorubrum sp. Ib24]|uniref:helix-hairpin-helix domain-containing protein n=1 Tax=unclassified Halorubrum TaxID=2642239 RepID=UPI000B999906|nr:MULTISPECIES: helix-hairpin-helix domain-containing protein [unclassified Halorubrum]OYR38343.1 serine/threonine kinase [Halorubrum sp. Ib24]OYR50901.1 serine/threonine kinase [Halorubrum sp. Ea1]
MSDRFDAKSESYRIAETFQLEEIPQVDVEKFETVERAAVERVITEQQESLVRLQTDVLDVRTERDALEHQLSKLTDDRERLQERVRELEMERPALEPKTVFSNLGAALEAADEDLSSERYRVDDVDFTLKANVTQTEEGVRMHLPSLDESSLSANLSEVSFRLRAPRTEPERPETEYVDVPELRGLSREAAVSRLTAADLAVGTVERAPDPTTTPGAVVEQFPDAYAVAEPGAPVDLVLAEEPGDDSESADESSAEADTGASTDSDATGGSDSNADEPADDAPADETGEENSDETAEERPEERTDDEEKARMEAFRRAIVEVDPENGSAVADRLRRAGVTDLDALVERDPEELAELLSIPVERVRALQEELGGREEPIELESVSGIGPTYASRLREKGIGSVARLSTLEPETVAEITRASTSRAADWIEQATRLTEER